MTSTVDPRREDKIKPYKSLANNGQSEDFLPDYFNILGMIFSMCGLMMKLKWCGMYYTDIILEVIQIFLLI